MKLVINKYYEAFLLILFIIVNVLLYLFSIENAPLSVGADAGQYLRPARSLVDLGVFSLNPPGWTSEMGDGVMFTIGTPLYSIFLAPFYYLFGTGPLFYISLVILQCAILYLTGWISRFILFFFGGTKKYAFLLHALVIFNPNSLITAHLLQSETLFTLFLTLSTFYLFKMVSSKPIKNMILVGVFAGLLALTRPAGLYMIYALPLIVFFIFVVKVSFYKESGNFRIMSKAIIPLLVALTIVSPWYVRNYINTGEYFLSTTGGYFFYDNHIQLLQRGDGHIHSDAVKIAHKELSDVLGDRGVDLNCAGDRRHWKCHKHVFSAVLHNVMDRSFESHAKALAYSWGVLYLSGGASNIRNYLGYSGNQAIVTFQHETFDGINSIKKLFQNAGFPYTVLLIVTMLFVLVTRLMALIGIFIAVYKKENTIYIAILLFELVLFTIMYLYLGQSRFRVPLEPILMLLAVLSLRYRR